MSANDTIILEHNRATSFSLETPIELAIDLEGGDVEIVKGPDGKLTFLPHVQNYSQDEYLFEFRMSQHLANVSGHISGTNRGAAQVRLEVSAPTNQSVRIDTRGGDVVSDSQLGNTRAMTHGGNIKVREVTGDAFFESSGGDVSLGEIAGYLEVRTGGGHVDVGSARKTHIETFGGNIDIKKTNERVVATTEGGDIFVKFISGVSGDLHSHGGNIEVRAPLDAKFTFDAEVVGGNIVIDPNIHGKTAVTGRDRVRIAINGGGDVLKTHTVGGDIRLLSVTES